MFNVFKGSDLKTVIRSHFPLWLIKKCVKYLESFNCLVIQMNFSFSKSSTVFFGAFSTLTFIKKKETKEKTFLNLHHQPCCVQQSPTNPTLKLWVDERWNVLTMWIVPCVFSRVSASPDTQRWLQLWLSFSSAVCCKVSSSSFTFGSTIIKTINMSR